MSHFHPIPRHEDLKDQDEKNVVVFTCLLTNKLNRKLTELAIQSLRIRSGFKGDIVLFTDHNGWFGVESYDIIMVPIRDFYKELETQGWKIPLKYVYSSTFRVFIKDFFDFSVYDKLIYLDYDVLTLQDCRKAFDFITDDSFYFTYAARKEWIVDNARGKQEPGYRGPFVSRDFDFGPYNNTKVVKDSVTGICAGIFGIKTEMLDTILNIWKNYLKEFTDNGTELSNQQALNQLILMERIKGKAFPNEWINYPLTPVIDCIDKRTLNTTDNFIFHHFNPGSLEIKLLNMQRFLKMTK